MTATDRRTFIKLAAGAGTLPLIASPAGAAQHVRHGLSVFGDLKYPAGFKHFDYVNTQAPKGGRIIITAGSWAYNQNPATFNTFNTFVLKGDAPPMIDDLLYDTLMVLSLDEPDSAYGLLAHGVEVSPDGNTYTYFLRPQARFHDGTPVTAQDMVFSVMILKEKGHPVISQTFRQLVGARAVDAQTLVLEFSGDQSRSLPLSAATDIPCLSRRFFQTHDFEKADLTLPMGSGPYKIGNFDAGAFIEYERDRDYWGRDLPVMRGIYNFDTVRLEFYRDSNTSFQAFTAGNIDAREEFSSKIWSTEYTFPAVLDGRVKRHQFPDKRPAGAQGWFLNTRREKFQDRRVREAIINMFDFEWSNANLFYGLYQRTHSFFQNSTMLASGPPQGEELALLEPYRDRLPAEVFGEPYVPPVSDGSGEDRRLLRASLKLFNEAGWKRQGNRLVNSAGEQMVIEFMSNSPGFERITLPLIKNLKLLGIDATFRLLDPAQYERRLRRYDFDVVSRRYAMTPTLGESIRQLWGSAAADRDGENNLSGIRDPVIDALIEKILQATSRDEMIVGARALDRVIRAGRYWVPQWYNASHNFAVWDKFGWPDIFPRYYTTFPHVTLWWLDAQKARALKTQ